MIYLIKHPAVASLYSGHGSGTKCQGTGQWANAGFAVAKMMVDGQREGQVITGAGLNPTLVVRIVITEWAGMPVRATSAFHPATRIFMEEQMLKQ